MWRPCRPWRAHRQRARSEAEDARRAVDEAQATRGHVEELARDLDRIRRENGLARRIEAAFRAHRGTT